MTEWEIITDSDNFPEPAPEQPNRSRSYQRWFLVAGTIVLLLMVGLVTLYRQWTERRTAMHEDLTTFIFAEETSQYFGQQEQATTFMMPNAPPAWREAYQQIFQTDSTQPPPDSIQLKEIDFDGQCALVTVELDGHEQVRTYCLSGQQWRRAPVPSTVWGDEQTVIELSNGVRLGFWPRDRAFAEALASDLPRFFEKLDQGTRQLNKATLSPEASGETLEIIIEPHDLYPPLITTDGQQIILNSPWLVPSGESKGLSGQTAVRLALAKSLLGRAGLGLADTTGPLPGVARFQTAAQTVMAVHLMLTPEAQARLLDRWLVELDGQWRSPFFAELLPPEAPPSVQQAELAAYLTVEYIYRLAGLNTLIALLQQLPAANSWDSLFQATLNRSTVELEEEVAAYIQRGEVTVVPAIPANDDQSTTPDLPLQATLLSIEAETSKGSRALVELSGQTELVLVELPPSLNFRTVDDALLPPGCMVPGARLEVDGNWLEVQRRLQATQMTVQGVAPLTIEPAPLDTIAYLLEGESPDEQALAIGRVFPRTRFYLIPSELFVPRTLVALRGDGTIQPLTTLSSTLQVVPLPIAAGGSVHFLFRLDLPNCDRTWFVHYEPMAGVTGQWLGPPQPMRWVWRGDRQDLMFFSPRQGEAGHHIYQTNDSLSLQPISQSDISVSFTGWYVKTAQLVFVKSWMGTTSIGLMEPNSGRMSRLKIYIHPIRARQLSPDGNWIAYLTGANNLFDPPYRLDLFSMERMVETTLLRIGEGEGLGPAIWSPYLTQPNLALLTGPLVKDDILRPNRLLVVSPEQPGTYEVVAEATAGEQLATPVFCADGQLLYRADQAGQYQLKRQKPSFPAETLLTRAQPFQPLACP